MSRTIEISLSGFRDRVEAVLLDDHEPEFAEHLWQLLEKPRRMWSWHPTVTGDWFACKARPERSKSVATGGVRPQVRAPESRRLMCDIEPGSIMYAADRMLRFAYGPKITEPLAGTRPVVARALNPYAFYAAGRHVLMSQFKTHQLVVLTVNRKDA